MDTLIAVIISGMAVAYLVEFLAELIGSSRLWKLLLSLPLGYVGCWFLGVEGLPLAVAGAASGFVSLALVVLASKPVQVINNTRR